MSRLRDAAGRFARAQFSGFKLEIEVDNLDQLAQRLDVGCSSKALRAGLLIRDYLRQKLVGPRSGRWYTIPGTGQRYQASAPGEYPAFRTGALLSTVRARLVQSPSGVRTVEVGAEVPYAKYLEGEGAGTGIRPFLSRAARECREQIRAVMGEEFELL